MIARTVTGERHVARWTKDLLHENSKGAIPITEPGRLRFLESLAQPPVAAALNIAGRIHQEQTRRIKEDPYINHPLEVAYYCDYYVARHPGVIDRPDILNAGALLHDVVEMHPDNRSISDNGGSLIKNLPQLGYNATNLYNDLVGQRVEYDDALGICDLVIQETPLLEDDKELIEYHNSSILAMPHLLDRDQEITAAEELQWRRRKRADLVRILEVVSPELDYLKPLLVMIKVADILANLRESVRDVVAEIDTGNSDALPSLVRRQRMFADRLTILREFIAHDYVHTPFEPLFQDMLRDMETALGELRGLI